MRKKTAERSILQGPGKFLAHPCRLPAAHSALGTRALHEAGRAIEGKEPRMRRAQDF